MIRNIIAKPYYRFISIIGLIECENAWSIQANAVSNIEMPSLSHNKDLFFSFFSFKTCYVIRIHIPQKTLQNLHTEKIKLDSIGNRIEGEEERILPKPLKYINKAFCTENEK